MANTLNIHACVCVVFFVFLFFCDSNFYTLLANIQRCLHIFEMLIAERFAVYIDKKGFIYTVCRIQLNIFMLLVAVLANSQLLMYS